MSSQQIQSEPSRSHNSSTSHTQDISLDHRIKAHNHPITSKQARSTNSGVAHPLPPRPARAPFIGGDCYMINRDVSTHRDRTTRPHLYDSYVPSRHRSHSPRRDDRSRRPDRHPYLQCQEYRARSPARVTTTSQPARPYQVGPVKSKGYLYHPTYSHGPPLLHTIAHPPSGMTTPDTWKFSPSYIHTSLQRNASHPADSILENLAKQGMLPGRPPNPGSPTSDNHGSQNQPNQPRRVSDSYRPRPMLMHRRPLGEPPNYANWTEEHLLDEVNVRRLSYEYENAAYLAEILHVNDSKFNERWEEIQHMSVQELREEAEAWNITVDALTASEHGLLLAEIAASAARDAVTNHNSLKRAMQVIHDREAKAVGKAKSLSEAGRLVRETAAKAAKAEEEKHKASLPVTQASKKRKVIQSQNSDSGYSTADAKPSTSPSDLNDDDNDEEGPVNRAKEHITARDTSQDHDSKRAATAKKASKRKSSSIDDGEGGPTKKQKTVETVAAKKTPVRTNPDEKSSNQKAVVLPQARKIRRTNNHGSGPKRVATPVASGEYTPATPVPSKGQVTNAVVVVDSDARNASDLKSVPGLSYLMFR